MPFVDTNVLLYALTSVSGDRPKQVIAREILRREDLVLSVQVLQEFYVQATRATRTQPLSHDDALALIRLWLRFRVVPNDVAVLQCALEIRQRYQLSYWDAAVVAAASVAGCDALYTEDLNSGQVIEGVRIENPFR